MSCHGNFQYSKLQSIRLCYTFKARSNEPDFGSKLSTATLMRQTFPSRIFIEYGSPAVLEPWFLRPVTLRPTAFAEGSPYQSSLTARKSLLRFLIYWSLSSMAVVPDFQCIQLFGADSGHNFKTRWRNMGEFDR